jgi:hypothetical protein
MRLRDALPNVHPNVSEVYRRKVTRLAAAFRLLHMWQASLRLA